MPLWTGTGEIQGDMRTKFNNLVNHVLEYGRFAKDLNTLLASSGFTYSTASLKTVAAGDLIKVLRGSHTFEVLPLGAASYDHVLPNGVLLSLLPKGDGWYDWEGMNPVADGVTDNFAKMQALLNNKRVIVSGNAIGPNVNFPRGRYYFSETINLKSQVRFQGTHTGFGGGTGTDFVFPAATAGIIVNRGNTLGVDTVTWTYGADGSEIKGIYLIGGRGDAFDPAKSGIWMRARARVMNCSFSSFAGHAVWAGAGSDGNPYLGNCNLFRVDHIWAQFCRGSAFCSEGTDANAGSCLHVDGKNNDRWCVEENSFLGNYHFGHHSESNALGSYLGTNQSYFGGCYTEDGSGGNQSIDGIQIGNTITAPNSGVGPKLFTEFANGPRGLANSNGGFIAGRGSTSAHLGSEDGTIVSGRHTDNTTPFRIGTYVNSARDAVIRWGSSSNNLISFGSGLSTRTFGRSAAVGEHVNIWTLFLGLNDNARALSYAAATPTSGNFARGDIVFLNAPSSGGVGQVHCTTGGVAGSTAVFRNAANLASS